MEPEFVLERYLLRRKDRKQLERLATELFSFYTRKKYADPYSMVKCITCHRKQHISQMHCGHYAPRANMCTKFMEINNHPQCPTCNVSYSGNLKKYKRYLDRTYGRGTADFITEQSRKTCKWTKGDLIDLIVTLEGKTEEL